MHSPNTRPALIVRVRCLTGSIFPVVVTQTYLSDEDDDVYLSPVLRKKAVKVKHVKRREKKFDKKVSAASSFMLVIARRPVSGLCF